MTIRFATATKGYSSVIARTVCASVPICPVNDNGDAGDPGDERMLWEALRHFAEHGLQAAKQAAESAEAARESGDTEGFKWWLSICRKLDRPMGESLARQDAAAG